MTTAKRLDYRRDVLPHLTLEMVFRGLKLRPARGGASMRGPCPLHDDQDKASRRFEVYRDSLGWKCWSCGKSGDPPKWIAETEGVTDFPSQVARLAELAGIHSTASDRPNWQARRGAQSGPRSPKAPKASKTTAETAPDLEALRTWDRALACDGTPAAAYLAGRFAWPVGLDGWTLPAELRWLPADRWPPKLERLRPEDAAGAMACAYRGSQGEVRALKLEALTADGGPALNAKGRRTRLNLGKTTGARFTACDLQGGELHVCEGEVTALAVAVSCHARGAGAAVAVSGHSGFRTDRCWGSRPVRIRPDRDAEGRTAARALRRALRESGRACESDGLTETERSHLDAADVLAAEVSERAAIRGGCMDRSAAIAAAWPEVIEGLRRWEL